MQWVAGKQPNRYSQQMQGHMFNKLSCRSLETTRKQLYCSSAADRLADILENEQRLPAVFIAHP